MTYEEVHILYTRLEELAVGSLAKGAVIESLFIGPTDWEHMTDFMNLRIQKGEDAAQIEFSRQGKSLSVYGVSTFTPKSEVPHWEMVILDDWEQLMSN